MSAEERRVRTSAKALVFRNGKLLALRLRDQDGCFYILPGGGQNAGETLPKALEREVREETGLSVQCGELAFVIEGTQGEPFHRVDLVFLCEALPEAQAQPDHLDTNQSGCDWLELAALNKAPLYPSRLRRPIMNLIEGKPHPIYLGNECMGDPEITD